MKKLISKSIIISVIASLLFEATPVWALNKDETVYVKLNSDGSKNTIVVSEHLSNVSNDRITDRTKLLNIKNVNGEEKYKEENDSIVWENNGNDIYYQGSYNGKLPIELDIKYYLDDVEMKASEMVGKKGKVKIVFNYKNNDRHKAIVNGRLETLYTPFLVAMTTIISNTNNKNYEVSNGKIVDNGVNSVVVALATPGLYDSLGIDQLKELDTITLTYDTEYFEMGPIYSIATPKLIEEDDLKVFDEIDSLYGDIGKLVDASNQIKNGSQQLQAGAEKLRNGTNELKNGINGAYVGSKTIRDTVNVSIDNLRNDNSAAIDDATLNGIGEQAAQSVKAELDATFTDAYKAQIGEQAVNAIRQSDSYKNLANKKTQLEAAGVTMELVQTCSQTELDESTQTMCAPYANYITQYTTLLQMITIMEETARGTAINTAVNTAYSTSDNVARNVSKNTALQVATNAKKQAQTQTIASLEKLVTGLDELTTGLAKLDEGANTLYDGTTELSNGINALASGIEEFNRNGINKIANLLAGDFKTFEGKVKALVKLSNDYGTLDDIDENSIGTTKLIMVIDEVRKKNDTKASDDEIGFNKVNLAKKYKRLSK